MRRFHELNDAQAFALFLYGRVKAKEYPVCSKSPSISLTINTDLAKCYDIARSAIHGEPT